jgi:hypothetical protein
LPYDERCNADVAPLQVSTPYLDAQIGLPLLILAAAVAGCVVRGAGRRAAAGVFLAAPVLYTAVVLYLSVKPVLVDELPAVFRKLQFVYRLISFVNLGLLLVPLFALLWRARREPGAPRAGVTPVLLCFALTYGGCCVLLKLQHAQVVAGYVWPVAAAQNDKSRVPTGRWVKTPADRVALVQMPHTMYGRHAYATPTRLAPAESPAPLRLLGVESRGGYFGETHRLTVTLDRPGYVGTEAMVFPWNQFSVDGVPVPAADLRMHDTAHTAVPVPAGTHTIQHRFVPARKWRVMHRASRFVLLGWLLAIAGLSAARFVQARRARAAAPVPAPAPHATAAQGPLRNAA